MSTALQIIPGYEPSIFVEAPHDKFICAICMNVVKDARQCINNGHCFCLNCITAERALRNVCPMCKDSIHILSRNAVVDALVRDMKTICKSRDTLALAGELVNSNNECCNWIGPLKERDEHFVIDCLYFLVKCPHPDCEAMMQRRMVNEHTDTLCEHRNVTCQHCKLVVPALKLPVHDIECLWKSIPCVCGVNVVQPLIQDHKQNDCPAGEVQCPFIALGLCAAVDHPKLQRRDLLKHTEAVGRGLQNKLTTKSKSCSSSGGSGKGKRKHGESATSTPIPTPTIHTRSKDAKK